MFEYSDSIEELQASAIREHKEFLKEILALIGFVLGTLMTYGFVGVYAPGWPKALRWIAILVGGSLSGFLSASAAVPLKMLFAMAFAVGAVGGLGYLFWKLL